ncbi:MAG TPA: hypothetical protein IAB03_08935 [Candidatus Gallibacteroides avistercoris]|uniref:Uncharacterized protein n=1 Tax=Candidatus Gallibacteroides avistercoris TaxID=2840833 RepID=A0A9D1SDT2_9BACT|nr:hypothetical protein [Candidatus Gallibacteroides avistercoris]
MMWVQIFIMLLLAAILYPLFRWIFRRIKQHKIWAILCAVILAPIIYTVIIWIVLFYVNFLPERSFNQEWWLNNSNKRYEMADDIINSGMLLGKSKQEVIQLLGEDYVNNENEEQAIGYDLGLSSESPYLPDKILNIEFEGDKVVNVSVW